jgi:uncharacterized surface protein with fasciclin (FAS1) repeats
MALVAASALVMTACSDEAEPLGIQADRVEAGRGAPAPTEASIAAVAQGAGFYELLGALEYVDAELGTGLVELFSEGRGQYTVFAPTDAAFADLYELLSAVLGTEIRGIRDVPAPVVLSVLQYHVAEGRRAAVSVVPRNGERGVETLVGERFYVRPDKTIRDGLTGVRGVDASIAAADISARNGIVHVISQVIVPTSVVAALTN